MNKNTANLVAVAIAATLWFLMFSPWTSHGLNFWLAMSCSAILLSLTALFIDKSFVKQLHFSWTGVAFGLAIAVALWVVFWIGDKLSQFMFDFARPQVDTIYGMKGRNNPYVIGWLLLCIIGPAEELFWRGFLQYRLTNQFGARNAMYITLACYTLIHIWSFNFMLVMAAMTAGLAWGLLYRLFPKQLFALVLSHAVWDLLAFIVLPI